MERHVTIGIAGHVDHGKTALVRCLTGVDTDRHKEEKRRGLSIESGIAPLELTSRVEIALVDVPGHTDFLKNTIRGLSSLDMAILVVAADDGVMPQTLDHLEILQFHKTRSGFIVLSKADLVDDETMKLAELDIRDIVKGTFLEGKPIIPFSRIDKRGLHEIRLNIEREVERIDGKDPDSPFRLWIDQVRSFAGFGTVVSGTILSGRVRRDDLLHLLPSGIETRARFLEVHHKSVAQAVAGQRVGINLHKVPLGEVSRGMVLAAPGSLTPSRLLNAELKLLKSAPRPIRDQERVRLYVGTSVTNALVIMMDKERLKSGESGLVQFRLRNHVAACPGDPFILSPLDIQTVIGGGRVLEITGEKYREAKALNTLPYLKALQKGDLKMAIEYLFKRNLNRLVKVGELARNTGFSVKEVEADIKSRIKSGNLLYFEGKGVFSNELYQDVKRRLPEPVKEILLQNPLKMGVSAEEIKDRSAPSLDEAPFQRMLRELCQEGRLVKTEGGYQIPNLSARLSAEQEMLLRLLLDYAKKSGFVPFSADTFWKFHKKVFNKNEIQRLLDYLHTQKRLIRLNKRRYLSPQAMEKIKERVGEVIRRKGSLNLADSKEILGYGRTVGISVVEYLDAIGFTLRQRNERVLRTS